MCGMDSPLPNPSNARARCFRYEANPANQAVERVVGVLWGESNAGPTDYEPITGDMTGVLLSTRNPG